jgi:hypothetical protein
LGIKETLYVVAIHSENKAVVVDLGTIAFIGMGRIFAMIIGILKLLI